MTKREDALDYHRQGRPGKIAVVPTKPLTNQRDLGLAYSPGVAEPCLEIEKTPDDAYLYTSKGNLVAVVTNGTAVLGLGNIGALAGKPVMEGKGNLFKQFADLDVFDLEVGSEKPEDVIRFCQLLEPTVGGINLEDIRSPDCFLIEETLRKTMKIPVFHDDQHGTAIISGAALLNALEVTGKKIEDVQVVFSGAGAAAISTAEHYVRLGVKREHIMMCDREGVIHADRVGHTDPYKDRFKQQDPKRGRSRTRWTAPTCSSACPPTGAVTPDMVAQDGAEPDHLRARESRSRDHARRGAQRARRRDHRDRAQRLPQPDQQRPLLPVHLPRRARRARHADQRGDEDGGDARPRRAGQGGRARQRLAAVRAQVGEVRRGVPDSLPVRSARAAVGRAGGRVGGGGERRRQGVHRPRDVPRRSSRRGSAARAASCAASSTARTTIPSASCSPRARS